MEIDMNIQREKNGRNSILPPNAQNDATPREMELSFLHWHFEVGFTFYFFNDFDLMSIWLGQVFHISCKKSISNHFLGIIYENLCILSTFHNQIKIV